MFHLNKLIAFVAFACFSFSTQAQENKFVEVAYDDCGEIGKQPHLVLGESKEAANQANIEKNKRTFNVGPKIIYAFDKMDIHANYQMEISFLADSEREIEVSADGRAICENIVLPAGQVVTKKITLPRLSYAYGNFVMILHPLKGDNAVISEIKLFSDNHQELTAVSEETKNSLQYIEAFKVDKDVNVESVLPTYLPVPSKVTDVYNNKISLNGVWQFAESLNEEDWHPIQVPGQWNMQGFKVDSANYARYRKTFEIPQDWKGNQIVLRFDGVHSEYIVFVNDEQVGYHMGGMTPYEMDITDFVKGGNNLVEVQVRSESLADMLGSLTQYAAHQLGGITRKVTLFSVPKVHLSDLRIVTDLDDQYVNSKLKLFAAVTNKSNQKVDQIQLKATLDKHTAAGTAKIPAIAPGDTWKGWMEFDVAAPALWDNEHPNLYKLHVDLCDGDQTLSQVEKRFGFREIEVKGNQMFVNGRAVKLRGVCRHESHPIYGRALTDQEWKTDAELYRAANCNFIRTSHYPPAEEFIEYCDELGLFVELEAPVCWIGHEANYNWKRLNYKDDKYYEYVLQVDMETVHFYRNHPSILFWSMANESKWNKGFGQVAEYMKKADITRPFAFHDQAYGGYNNQGSNTPISNMHYPGPEGYKHAAKSARPMTFGEYTHLNVYNRSELVTDPGIRSDWALALAPMWENMYKTDGVLGGSIWSGIDDIFQLPDGNAVGYGAWGPIDGWRRPKPEYWDMKKVYSPIKLHTNSLEPAKELVVRVENRYTFTNFNELKIQWKFGNESGISVLNINPKEQGDLVIPVKDPTAANELALTFTDHRGFVADEYVIPVGAQPQNQLKDLAKIKTKVKQTKAQIQIVGENFRCIIDKATGGIVSVERNNKQILSGGPWLMALPLTGGGCFPNHNIHTPIINDLCKGWVAKSVQVTKENPDIVVNVEGAYKDYEGSYDLRINANGEIQVDYKFLVKSDIDPRQWGMVFETPKDFDETFWRRKGLWSVYPADHISRPIGKAISSYQEVPEHENPRVKPTWAWSKDQNQLGSNDFRSTRRNIWYAGLNNHVNNTKVTVRSNSEQHWRSWKEKENTRFLVADFVTAGAEGFLGSHYAPFRKPLKVGDTIQGSIVLRVE